MGSVRDRIERSLREAPEQIVETGTRRVALGASGPTMSTRQKEQLAADANEVLTPSPYTRTGGTDFMSGNLSRVRDRMVTAEIRQPEPARPKTPSELAMDAGLAMRERWAAEAREAAQEKLRRRAEREQQEKAAAELKQKRAVIAFQETAVLHEASDLDADEAQIFWTRLASMNALLDAGAASVVAEEIRSNRKY